MTALALDVRELSFDEIDCVNGGSRLIAAARWIASAVASGMAYDAAKAAWNALPDMARDKDEQDPYSLAKIG